MEYQLIKVSYVNSPDRFFRTLYVRRDLTLKELAYGILKTLRSEFCHMYLIKDKKYTYVDESWLDEFEDYRDYDKYKSNDLCLNDNYAILEYDTGESYEFKIEFYQEYTSIDDDSYAIVVEAKGDRIWEDGKSLLDDYLEGLTPEALPWNLPIDADPSDFDKEIDIDMLNKEAYTISFDLEEAQDDEEEYYDDRMLELLNEIDKFNKDRDWDQFHTESNLAKSISIEAGELLECFQWSDTEYDQGAVLEELADVMSYCFQMAMKLNVDPIELVRIKMAINEKKYPVDKAKGKSTKYNKL